MSTVTDLFTIYRPGQQRDPDARYPENMRVTQAESKDWPESLRTVRTCQYCRKIYRHAGAAITCEHSHRRGGSTTPGASP